MFKKILFASVALTLSLTALAGVVQTDAATLAEGGLYKTATDSAIYLIQGSEKRVFPHAAVYKSWGYPDDYSTVETVSTAELAEFTDGTAVPFRDGSMFRGSAASIHDKDQTAVFFVSDNKVRDIKSSEIYHALFDDPNWEYVTWVPDDLLTKFEYELGTQIDSSATYPNGSLISNGGKTYLVADGELREFETGALAANRYDVSAAITPVYPVASIDDYVAGDAVGGEETVLVTPGVGPDAPDPDLPGTGLTIALASDTPISDVVIQNAARVPFTKIKLTASSDGDVEVQLTIKRTGLGQDSNLASIVFIDADTNRQIGNSKSLSSSNHSCMSNTMTVEAGETRNILIAANMGDDTTSGQEVYPGELLSLDVIEVITDATVNGTLPIEGNEMTANDSIILGTVTVNRGSDDPNLGGTATTKEIGTKNLELISAKILAGSVEAFFIEGIEFENYNGTAEDTDLENLTLYVDSESYATGLLDGGIIYFDLTDNPVEIAKGKKKEFMLKGDIVDGSDRTLDFDIYDQIDIIAKGEEFKRYRLPTYTIDSTDSTAEPYFNAGNTYTIGVGTLSASASNFTPVQNIAEGTDGIALGSWTLNAKGEPIEISKLRIDFDFATTSGGSDAYGSSTNLTNVAIFDENGDRKTSITDMTATSTFSTGGNQDGYISWTDTWTVPVGEHVIR